MCIPMHGTLHGGPPLALTVITLLQIGRCVLTVYRIHLVLYLFFGFRNWMRTYSVYLDTRRSLSSRYLMLCQCNDTC